MMYLTQIIMAFIGSLGFSILFNIKGKKLLYAAFGGMLGWASHIFLFMQIDGELVVYFIPALLVTIYSEICARIEKTPTTSFLIAAIIPLVPGRYLYYTMSNAVNGDYASFVNYGVDTLAVAISISAGIMAATSLFRLIALIQQSSQVKISKK